MCQSGSDMPTEFWFVVAFAPLVVVLFTEMTKHFDRKVLQNEFDNRRFMFDTRLGCYSPK